MRAGKTLKNSGYSIVSYFLLGCMALISRKVFLQCMPIELLGYEGLFANIFAILSVSDLGIDAFILYRLYPAVINNDKNEISKLVAVFKYLYKLVIIFIIVVSFLLIPFLKYIIKDGNMNWNYIYLVYIIQLISMLCTYMMAHKRILFTVYQKEYICVRIDTICNLFSGLLRIFILLVFQSYVFYLLIGIIITIFSNVIISFKANKEYPLLKDKKIVSLNDIREMGIFSDVSNNFFQKICVAIYNSTDNILISTMLGITQVGLFSNYLAISNQVSNCMIRVLKPFQISIGDFIHSKKYDEGYKLFRMFDMLGYLMSSSISICFLVTFEPFIEIWVGHEYRLGIMFVVIFSLNQYILWNHQFLCHFRYAFGRYELDRTPVVIAAILNIVVSIVLCKIIGISGIMFGTVIGHLGIWFGRVNALYKIYIKESVMYYFFRQITRFVILIGSSLISLYICNFLNVTIMGIIFRIILGVFIPSVINFLVFFFTEDGKLIIEYLKRFKKF